MAKRQTYILTRDIIIPAGTIVHADGPFKVHYAQPRASVLMAVTKDVTSEWAMYLDEAIETGLVVASDG